MNSAISSPMRIGLHSVADQAADFLETLVSRPCCGTVSPADLIRTLDRPLPDAGLPAEVVIRELVHDVERGLVASASPRYFGFVMSGATRASLMADWLTSAWDQNAQVYGTSPAAAAIEAIVARWLLELFALPAESSVGFVTGGQMANFTALATARNAVLERAGWEVATQGLFGAPPTVVFISECVHATVRAALQMAGIGSMQIREIPADSEGRMDLLALEAAIRRATGQPMVVSLQAGNVNSGAFEPVEAVADLTRRENAWIHVDGAFGLWAAVSPKLGVQLAGMQRADSWATDAHKWLNVPYDSGIVIVKDSAQHRRLKSSRCSYSGEESAEKRDGSAWVPENSRRARGFVLYAVLRELGRLGIRAIVERCCTLARQFAVGVAGLPGTQVVNEVGLNQVLVRCCPPEGEDADEFHHAIASRVQADGRCWLGTTTWRGQTVLRFSICNASTTAADISVALEMLSEAIRSVSGRRSAKENADGRI